MATLKELKTKIDSLKSTQKMTKTMKLVAASRMRKATLAQENAKDYAEKLDGLLSNVAGSAHVTSHPLLEKKDPVKKVLMVVVASDRGLCGGFNNNLFRDVGKWCAENTQNYDQFEMSFCGRRANSFFRQLFPVKKYYEGVTDRPRYETAEAIADELMNDFMTGDYDEIYVAYNRFRSALKQIPTITKFLPIEEQDGGEAQDASRADSGYIHEPEVDGLMNQLLPYAVRFRMYNTLLENSAGEHAARMAAMDSATRNAGDLIDHYTLLRNRERQAAITTELIDIVVGAESL